MIYNLKFNMMGPARLYQRPRALKCRDYEHLLSWPGAKKPRNEIFRSGDSLFILKIFIRRLLSVKDSPFIQVGLLTLGLSYGLNLPILIWQDSGMLQSSSPITAAGPSPNFTGFPIMLKTEHLNN